MEGDSSQIANGDESKKPSPETSILKARNKSKITWKGDPLYRSSDGNKYYSSFTKNGDTYFPQDFIFTTNVDSKPTTQKRPTIAQLSSMHETTKGGKYATIRYFYRPEETVIGRTKENGAKQLFCSNHYETIDLNGVNGKVTVETKEEFTSKGNPSFYYCDGFYDHSAASLSPATPSRIFKTPTPKKKQSTSNSKVVGDSEKSKEEESKSQKKRKSEDEIGETNEKEAKKIKKQSSDKEEETKSSMNKQKSGEIKNVKEKSKKKSHESKTKRKKRKKMFSLTESDMESSDDSPKKKTKKKVSKNAKSEDSDSKMSTDENSSSSESDKKDPKSPKKPPSSKRSSRWPVGTIAWAKMRSWPWWPAKVVSQKHEEITQDVLAEKRKNTVLVRFYGGGEFAWIDRKGLIDFRQYFKERSKTKDENLLEAIEDAIEDCVDKEELHKKLEDDDAPCEICHKKGDGEKMLLCDNCDSGYHIFCLNPPLSDIPETNWYCDDCKTSVQYKDINVDSIPITIVRPGVVGLANLGASCYINAAVQCLNGASSFRNFFKNKTSVMPSNAFISSLQAVIQGLWTDKGVGSKVLSALKEASGQFLDFKYYSHQHQDINEYLVHLLDFVHTQLKNAHKHNESHVTSSPNTPKRGSKRSEKKLEIEANNGEKSSEKVSENGNVNTAIPENKAIEKSDKAEIISESVVIDDFDGKLARTRICPQGHKSENFEIFRILPLQFPPQFSSKKIKLEDLLEDFSVEEPVECRCTTCGLPDDLQHKLRTTIYRFPTYLIIQIGRFTSGMQDEEWWSNKVNAEVVYPLARFDLAKVPNLIHSESTNDPSAAVYDLFAVANHKGGMNGGHYWCFVRDESDNTWFNFNDNVVKPISPDYVQSPYAYMLFYKRSGIK